MKYFGLMILTRSVDFTKLKSCFVENTQIMFWVEEILQNLTDFISLSSKVQNLLGQIFEKIENSLFFIKLFMNDI